MLIPCAGTQTLGIHVHKYYLHWALKSVNITYIGLFGSLGKELQQGFMAWDFAFHRFRVYSLGPLGWVARKLVILWVLGTPRAMKREQPRPPTEGA